MNAVEPSPRVLMLIQALGRGGAEQQLLSLAPYLDFEVAFVDSRATALRADIESHGRTVHDLAGHRDKRWPLRLRRLVREREIDIVHSFSPRPGAIARVTLGGTGVLLAHSEQAMWPSYHPVTRVANAATYWRNRRITAVSEGVVASMTLGPLTRLLPIPPVEVVHNSLDLAAFDRGRITREEARARLGVPADRPLVGTVANFKPVKGHVHLVAAARRVREVVPDVCFVLVGEGVEEPNLRAQVDRLGLTDAVIFAGMRTDAAALTAGFDVFALPSLYEGFGVALLEAMAAGNAIVASRTGGVPEVLAGGRHGVLVEPASDDDLAQALVSLLTDPSRRAELAESARSRAESFDARTTATRSREIYASIASGR
jgi:glycosyltransferase involved in cell wall biosynthesis